MVVIIELYDVYYRFWFLYYSNFIKNDYMLYNIFLGGIMFFYYIIDMKIIVIIYIIMIIVFVENVIMFYFCYV